MGTYILDDTIFVYELDVDIGLAGILLFIYVLYNANGTVI